MEARSQRVTVGGVMLVAALVVAGVFAPVGVQAQEAAPAEARSLTVTPSSDLDDGQTVTVDGTGWRPGALVLSIQCMSGTETCGGAVANRPVDPDGTFTMELAVRAVFTAFDGTPVDCRVDACEVLAVNEENEDHTASVPIAFDPATVLLPPPTMTVTPDADLVDGQTVTVAGAGFLPGTTMFLAQCRPGQPTMEGCGAYRTFAEIDGSGAFSADLRVVATFFHPDGTVDCRAEACELVVGTFFGGVQARAAVSFDPDGPLLGPPTLTVTPDERLVDGQAVQVRGAGFRPGSTVAVGECGDGDGEDPIRTCSTSGDSAPFTVDAEGTFTRALTVHRSFNTLGGGSHDCAVHSCLVRALVVDDLSTVDVPITFAPEAADGPTPATPVAATPRFTG